jgi:hypothetical protein
MPGVVNDPSNYALRQSILQFGMGQFCHEMQNHDAPLSLAAGSPVIGRFYTTSCQQQQLENKDYFIQFGGYGYGWTNLSRKLTFTMTGAVVYAADFQLAGSTMYIYFRPRPDTIKSSFQSHVIEQPVASFLNSMSSLGNTFGNQIVATQLNQGFTVIRDSNGSADFSVGIVDVGRRPQHPIDVHGNDRVTWENTRVEVHQNERDFVGPIEITDSGRAIFLTASVAGPAIDVLLLKKDVGDASLRLYFDYAQAGPLSGPPLSSDAVQPGINYQRAFPVDPGQYYLVFDNTPTAGTMSPPMNVLDDRFATVSYAVQTGDAP